MVFDNDINIDVGMALAPHQDATEYGQVVA
jgi:hypothetical protein